MSFDLPIIFFTDSCSCCKRYDWREPKNGKNSKHSIYLFYNNIFSTKKYISRYFKTFIYLIICWLLTLMEKRKNYTKFHLKPHLNIHFLQEK